MSASIKEQQTPHRISKESNLSRCIEWQGLERVQSPDHGVVYALIEVSAPLRIISRHEHTCLHNLLHFGFPSHKMLRDFFFCAILNPRSVVDCPFLTGVGSETDDIDGRGAMSNRVADNVLVANY